MKSASSRKRAALHRPSWGPGLPPTGCGAASHRVQGSKENHLGSGRGGSRDRLDIQMLAPKGFLEGRVPTWVLTEEELRGFWRRKIVQVGILPAAKAIK